MWIFLFIAIGGAAGAVSRYAVGLALAGLFGAGFQPVATLIVNIIGSGLMGFCFALISAGLTMSDHLRGLIMIGFLGGLTTFSSFSLDAISMIEKGDLVIGLAYIFASVILSLIAFMFVMVITRGYLTGH